MLVHGVENSTKCTTKSSCNAGTVKMKMLIRHNNLDPSSVNVEVGNFTISCGFKARETTTYLQLTSDITR